MHRVRNITEKDVLLIRNIAKQCYPLDVHTHYTYWVVTKYYNDCSYIIESNGTPIGYIMAVDTPTILFIWQIGILKEYRGKHLSERLISMVVRHAKKLNKDIEVSIAPDNKASYFSFKNYCEKYEIEFEEIGEVNIHDPHESDFHEYEILYRIGFS